jgi:hypothetical protein
LTPPHLYGFPFFRYLFFSGMLSGCFLFFF